MTHPFQVGNLTDIDPNDPSYATRELAGERATQLSMNQLASFFAIWDRRDGSVLGIAYAGRLYWEAGLEGQPKVPALGWRRPGAVAA